MIYTKNLALQKLVQKLTFPVAKSGIYTINDKHRKDYFWIMTFSILILIFNIQKYALDHS